MTSQQSAYVGIKKHNTCINSTFIWPLKSSMCNTWVRNEHMETKKKKNPTFERKNKVIDG